MPTSKDHNKERYRILHKIVKRNRLQVSPIVGEWSARYVVYKLSSSSKEKNSSGSELRVRRRMKRYVYRKQRSNKFILFASRGSHTPVSYVVDQIQIASKDIFFINSFFL